MDEFELYRFNHHDGSSKDWAIRDNRNGTFTPAGIAGIQVAGMPQSHAIHGAWVPAVHAGTTSFS